VVNVVDDSDCEPGARQGAQGFRCLYADVVDVVPALTPCVAVVVRASREAHGEPSAGPH